MQNIAQMLREPSKLERFALKCKETSLDTSKLQRRECCLRFIRNVTMSHLS